MKVAMENIKLTLYVIENDQASIRTKTFLENLIRDNPRVQLEVLDLFENITKAREQTILAVPTLIREHPPPSLRFLGDLSGSSSEELFHELLFQE